MFNKTLKISATAAMLLAVPAIAGADTIAYSTTAPVAVSSYVIHETDTSDRSGDAGERPHYVASGLTLDFVNRSNVAATAVTFLLTDGKHTQRFVDKGTFARGVSISHSFDVDDGLSDVDDAVVDVAGVDFADGGAWHADSVKTVALVPMTTAKATTAPISTPVPATRRSDAKQDDTERQRIFRHLGTSL